MPRRTQSAAASRTATNKTRPATDALQMLKQDHDKVSELFVQFIEGDAGNKRQVAHQIFKELEIHSTLEEELFYPALQNQGDPDELAALEHGDEELDGEAVLAEDDSEEEDEEDEEINGEMDEDVIASAYEDHQAVKELIHRLKGLDPNTSDFQQGMMELREMVTDHAAEEEDVLFTEAKLKLDTNTLGVQMQERKQELMSPTAG
ncbi:MAG TPA: hemerythrin domain-containing protein [Nitrospiraceae bacterium]|nr:hemerythrin domain-containing protein [Nitrospiraceae bacterium]